MTVEITLPLLGTYNVWLGAICVAIGMLCAVALMIAVHIDSKKEGN